MELQEENVRIQIEAVADAFGSPFYPFQRRKQNGFITSVFHNSIRTISVMLNAPKSTIAPVMATMGRTTTITMPTILGVVPSYLYIRGCRIYICYMSVPVLVFV
jgi:hypothetical protein